MKKLTSLLVGLIISAATFSTTYKVADVNQYKSTVKKLLPGDSIVLANGIWKNAEFSFKGNGESGKYIYMVAETPGKVTLEGKSRLQLSGNFLYVSGFVFVNGSTPKSAVIEFRTGSTDYAYNSVVSNCVIDKYNQQQKDSSDHWVGVYGKKNTVEYCYFGGKSNNGTTLVIWPNDSNSINNGHLIYRNYFGPRQRLGANGGETIRIGTSQVCHMNSSTIVDGNFFEHCNGEVEIISNKSGDNKLVNNTFYECEGSLVLRHGNNATVAGNWFIGNGKPFTGGVRVINEGHKIYNNFFYKLAGDEFRSGLAVMNAIPNSPANGYAPVRNVLIANNTYYDCAYPWAFGVGKGERNRIVKPESTLLLNNLVYCKNTTDLVKFYDQCDGVKFDNNLLISSKGTVTEFGGVEGNVNTANIKGLETVFTNLKAKKLPFIKYDILGQLRGEPVIGAFQNQGINPAIEIATSENCGPDWYKPTIAHTETVQSKPVGKTINIAAGTDVLSQAIKKAGNGDVLLLSAGEHVISNKIVLSKNITIKSSDPNAKAILKMQSARENNSFFEISGNTEICFENVVLNGESKGTLPAKYAFVTNKENATGYKLILNSCEVTGFNVDAGAIFKAYKGSLADSIIVRNSVFSKSYRGFSLADEKDDMGKYNADNIVFQNTVFSDFTQFVIDFYRGGNDESTLGGALFIDHCIFDNVAGDEKQSIIKSSGIVTLNVTNSIFSNSVAKQSIKLSGSKNSISNCAFYNCTEPKIEKGAKSQSILSDDPKFEKKSYKLSKKSKLIGKGTEGSNVGLM